MKKINPDLLFEDLVHNPADSLGDSERFIFPCGDGALWGQVMRPDGSFGENRPCVLVLHGFPGGNRNDDIAHALCRIGCVVLVMHHRGAWGSPGKYTVSNCIEDIKALAEHVRGNEFANEYHVDPESVYLFGHSMGGNNSVNAAKELPWLRGIMLLAPYDPTYYLRNGKPEVLKSLMDSGAEMLNCDGAEAMFADIEEHAHEWDFTKAAEILKDQNILAMSGKYDEIAPENEMVSPLWNELGKMDSSAVHRHCSYLAGHALVGCRIMVLKDVVKFLEDTL